MIARNLIEFYRENVNVFPRPAIDDDHMTTKKLVFAQKGFITMCSKVRNICGYDRVQIFKVKRFKKK